MIFPWESFHVVFRRLSRLDSSSATAANKVSKVLRGAKVKSLQGWASFMAKDGSALVWRRFLSLENSVKSSFAAPEPLLRLDLLDSKLNTDLGRGLVFVGLTSDMMCRFAQMVVLKGARERCVEKERGESSATSSDCKCEIQRM